MTTDAKRRVFEVLHKGLGDDQDLPSRTFEISIMALISLNVLAVILETVDPVRMRCATLFRVFEVFSVTVFTVEYITRLWSCTSVRRYRHPVLGRLRFAITPMALIDLLAILPFYVPMFLPVDLRFVRAFRLLRLFKLGRYSDSMRTLGAAIRSKRDELSITVTAVFVLLIVSSSLMYFVEHTAQPEAFASIPSAMWWGVATLTTVGYGDVYPVTVAGKLLGALIALLGIATFALPAGIIASGFTHEMQRRFGKGATCPHCGEQISGRTRLLAASGVAGARRAAADYEPQPIDTSHVSVPAELNELADHLARHVHDVWALQRLAEGWEYGPQRNEIALTHPDLVPYEALLEGEKQYDLATATGTIKAILALGYRVQKRSRQT